MEKFRNIEYEYSTVDDVFIIRGLQANQIVDAVTDLEDAVETLEAAGAGGIATGRYVARAEVLYSNTAQTAIVTLPADAVIWGFQVETVTGFTGSGDNYLDLGITGSVDEYYNNVNLASGLTWASFSPSVPARMTVETVVTFRYQPSVADASAGIAYVYLEYSLH